MLYRNFEILDTASIQNHNMQSFHDFSTKTLAGHDFDMASLKGKKVMVVNTASECGLTPQYEVLQEVYDQLGGTNFEIIGFPANNFGAQEPGTNDEIQQFCTTNFGVTFPMMAKVSVQGADQHPIYSWLTSKTENGVEDVEVAWNFQKFLIDEDGQYVRTVATQTSPADESILDWIQS